LPAGFYQVPGPADRVPADPDAVSAVDHHLRICDRCAHAVPDRCNTVSAFADALPGGRYFLPGGADQVPAGQYAMPGGADRVPPDRDDLHRGSGAHAMSDRGHAMPGVGDQVSAE
jgi:hypothetical protein